MCSKTCFPSCSAKVAVSWVVLEPIIKTNVINYFKRQWDLLISEAERLASVLPHAVSWSCNSLVISYTVPAMSSLCLDSGSEIPHILASSGDFKSCLVER